MSIVIRKTEHLPEQDPPSRIGRPIADFVPGEEKRSHVYPPVQGQQVSTYDVDGDGTDDVRVNRSAGSTSVDLLDENTILWADRQGAVYWEQRTQGDRFENAMMKDGLRFLVRGDRRTGRTVRYELETGKIGRSRGATRLENVDSARLTMPQAEVREPMRVVWHADFELGEVSGALDLGDLRPPLTPQALGGITSVDVQPTFLGAQGQLEASVEGGVLRFTAKDVDPGAWLSAAPIFELQLQSGATQTVAALSPRMIVDDTAPMLRQWADDIPQWEDAITRLSAELPSVEARIADPSKIATHYDARLAEARTALDQAEAKVTELRPALLADWLHATPEDRDTALGMLLEGGALPQAQLAALAEERAALSEGSPDAERLVAAGIGDVALAAFETVTQGAEGPFRAALEEQLSLTADVADYEARAREEREAKVVELGKRERYLERQIALFQARIAGLRLQMERHQPFTATSRHRPYTY